jgi:alanyl-tRNA synthetase
MTNFMSGADIRQSFIKFFEGKGHTFVPSSPLVPGGDQTLLFTNAGMVQFKDVFLGEDVRPYSRAVNSQKCMRVSGKHNDLEDVGRDDSHHTFFEMLGNWSFGDYYKKEAITWAWELLTEVWGLDRERLWATVFKDDQGDLPSDEEAAEYWKQQPGINPEQVLYFGRKDNLWEMAETGPCGPCSEIHMDLGAEYCDLKDIPGHVCQVNGDCARYLEIWNLVFMQYNRTGPTDFEPLSATHVDTGMGFERVVAIIQGVFSNYRTDLFTPLMDIIQILAGHTDEEREANLTPYRVIADHARTASFLIADGVVPGNIGRNYVCRMIIRRAARFGGKIGLDDPFIARVAEKVVETYGDAYPELVKNQKAILDNLTREEDRFRRTIEAGMAHLDELMDTLRTTGKQLLDGEQAFDLYATHGLPLEITRDILLEQGLRVEEGGFHTAMENHRLASGAGRAIGSMGGEDVDIYRTIFDEIIAGDNIGPDGVISLPYGSLEVETELLAILRDGKSISSARERDQVELILPVSNFYLESGGQVADKGRLINISDPRWEVEIEEIRKPAAGVIVHIGTVTNGCPIVGDLCVLAVDSQRRQDIMRNHTATHLLHSVLQRELGEHARQAGSLVAPDRLRFDFTHPEALTYEQLEKIEAGVNRAILENHRLKIEEKQLSEAMASGAMALFGEKYAEDVRTVQIGDTETISYELCGGTHVEETGDIGTFLIISEGSAAAGIRRIEAITGQKAFELIQKRFHTLKLSAQILESTPDSMLDKIKTILKDLDTARKRENSLRQQFVASEFSKSLGDVPLVAGVPVLGAVLQNAEADTLREMTDRFRNKYSSGVVVLASESAGKPVIIAAVTEDLVSRGVHAGELVKEVAMVVGGSGGGRATLAQAGGKDASQLPNAIEKVAPYVLSKLG